MKAIGFDLGKTLIDYNNVPLNWNQLYGQALIGIAKICKLTIDDSQLHLAQAILSKYNTRENPRVEEVNSVEIIREILECWNCSDESILEQAENEFFSFFRKEIIVFPDTLEILKYLRMKNIKIGILTDVPYGMNSEYLSLDMEPIEDYVDIVLSSADVGFRKPNKQGFEQLADYFKCSFEDMVFVGDEEKDIVGANNLGIYSVLIDRDGKQSNFNQKKTIHTLTELEEIFG